MGNKILFIHIVLLLFLIGCNNQVTNASISSNKPTPQPPIYERFEPIGIDMSVSTPSPEIVESWETIDAEMRSRYGKIGASCGTCVPSATPENCTKYLWTKYIVQPEWSELFPDANFYGITLRHIENGESNRFGYEQESSIFVQQGDTRYELESFHQLLNDNQIKITDENRELIIKSVALMTLADYIEDGIEFSDVENIDFQTGFERYNYKLTAWTKIHGLTIEYMYFIDENDILRSMVLYSTSDSTEDYIDEQPLGRFPSEVYFR